MELQCTLLRCRVHGENHACVSSKLNMLWIGHPIGMYARWPETIGSTRLRSSRGEQGASSKQARPPLLGILSSTSVTLSTIHPTGGLNSGVQMFRPLPQVTRSGAPRPISQSLARSHGWAVREAKPGRHPRYAQAAVPKSSFPTVCAGHCPRSRASRPSPLACTPRLSKRPSPLDTKLLQEKHRGEWRAPRTFRSRHQRTTIRSSIQSRRIARRTMSSRSS